MTLSLRKCSKIIFRGNSDHIKSLKKERKTIIQSSNRVHMEKGNYIYIYIY